MLVRVEGDDGEPVVYSFVFGSLTDQYGKKGVRKRTLKAATDEEAITEASKLCGDAKCTRLNMKMGRGGETTLLAAWEFRPQKRKERAGAR